MTTPGPIADQLPTALARVQFRMERLPDSDAVTLPKEDLRAAFDQHAAAELRRQAKALAELAALGRVVSDNGAVVTGLMRAAERCRARADELDPPA